MSENVLNLNKWVSKTYLAEKLKLSVQSVNNWASRGKIEARYIKELKNTLVRNIDSINDLQPDGYFLKK